MRVTDWCWRVGAALGLCAGVGTAQAADPERGARLFATPPQRGLLACADCHSEDPLVNNFGNIFVGRNAPALIQRAVDSNTGGMGFIRDHYTPVDFADIAAYLGVDPARVDFGRQVIGAPAALRSVTVRASSKAALSGLRLSVEGPFTIRDNRCAATVPARTACSVDLAFDASAAGAAAGRLLVDHDGTPTPAAVGLSAEAVLQPPAQVALQPSVLAFDGAGSRGRVRLSNPSASPLAVQRVATTSAAFPIVGGTCRTGSTLPAGSSCTWVVGYDPAAPMPDGAGGAELQVLHDGVGGASSVPLVLSAPASRPPWIFEARGLDFGVLEAGVESAPQRVRMRHVGRDPLRLQDLTVQGPAFRLAGDGDCRRGDLLQPGRVCTWSVTFQGQRHQHVSDELRVWAEGHAEPVRLGLAGRSVAETAWPDLVPRRLAWAGAEGGASDLRVSRLVNRGSAALRVVGLSIDGPDAGGFALDTDCLPGRSLGPGEACQARVRPVVPAAAERRARLRVLTDAGTAVPGAELAADLVVRAAPGSLRLDRTSVDLIVGPGAAPARVTVQHGGALPTTIRRIDVVGDHAAGFQVSGSCQAGQVLADADACGIDVAHAALADVAVREASLVIESSEGLALVALRASPVSAQPAIPVAASTWRLEGPGVDEAGAGGTRIATPMAELGAESAHGVLRLVHLGPASAVLRGLSIQGLAWSDFSIDPTQGCRVGDVLAPGARCELHLRFHPTAPGVRAALLSIGLEGSPPVGVPIEGRAGAPPTGWLQGWPEALRFDAAEPVPAERQVWVINAGSGVRELESGLIRGGGFTWRSGGTMPCNGLGGDLLADDGCTLLVAWSGSAAAAEGGSWTVTAGGDAAGQPLSVGEAPRVVNRGAGALGTTGIDAGAALALLAAAGLLARGRRARRTQ